MLKRVASAVVLLPVFLLIVVKAPGWMFNTLVVIASAAALWELMRLFERAGRPVYRWLGRGGGHGGDGVLRRPSRLLDPLVLPAFVLDARGRRGAVGPGVARHGRRREPAANTLLAILYVGWLLGFGILLHHTSPIGDELVLFLVGVTWVGETAAYLVGSTVGRHKLAPVISPKKTVEGAAAQVVASVISGVALGAWLLPAVRDRRRRGWRARCSGSSDRSAISRSR